MSRKIEEDIQRAIKTSENRYLAGTMSPAQRGAAKKRRKPEPLETNYTMFHNQNYYMDLDPNDSDFTDSVASGDFAHSKRTRKYNKPNIPNQPAVHQYVNMSQSKPVIPPPIMIENVRLSVLIEKIRKLENINQENISYKLTRGFIKILTKDKDTFDKVLDHCRTNELIGFSHSHKEERQVRFCMYGLPATDVALIATELNKFKLQPTKIRLLYQNKDYPDEAIHVLYFSKSQKITLEDFRQVTGLFGVRTRFQYFRNKESQLTQCSNCQKFGHGTQHCFRKPVCVRCAEGHKSKECPLIPKLVDAEGKPLPAPPTRPKIAEDKLKCALCQKPGHSAAWKGCEVRLREQTTRKTILKSYQNVQQHRHRAPIPDLQDKQDFPKISHKRDTHPLQTAYHVYQPAPRTLPETSPNPMANLISVEDSLKLLDYFIEELCKCTTVREQTMAIARFALMNVQQFIRPTPK